MWNKLLTQKESFSAWQLSLDSTKVKNFSNFAHSGKDNLTISNIRDDFVKKKKDPWLY